MPTTIKINGVEYELFDQNITSDEAAFSAFSGYMAFNGELPKQVLETMAKNYNDAIKAKVAIGEITEAVGEQMIKKYGTAVMGLVGRKINNVFEIADGVITAVFDKNMNPDKSLDEILVPRIVEFYLPTAFAGIGAKAGLFLGGPIGGVIGGVAGAVLGAIVSSINSDDWYKTAKSIVVDTYNMVLEYDKDNNHYKFSNEELDFTIMDNKATIVNYGIDLSSISAKNVERERELQTNSSQLHSDSSLDFIERNEEMGKFGAIAKAMKSNKNTSNTAKQQSSKPVTNTKKQESKQQKDNQQANDIPANVANTKGKKQANVGTKSKKGGDIVDRMSRALMDRDDKSLKSIGDEVPKHSGFFAIYHDLSHRYAMATALKNKHNTSMFSKIADGAKIAIGASAMAYAAYSTLGGDFLGSKEARLLDKDSKIEDEQIKREQDNFHKGLVVENLSDDLGIEASNTRELANGLKNVDDGKEILDDLISEVCIEALKDSSFAKNIENLEKSVNAVEKTFGLDDEQIKFQNVVVTNENILELAFGDSLDSEKRLNLMNALHKFHSEVQNTGNINLKDLQTVLKQSNFSDEEIKKLVDTIDDERKFNPNYIVHNANIFASINDKKEQVALAKELIVKGKDITNDDITKFVEAHGYKGLMAVAKNMNIDGSMSKTEKALAMLRGNEGDAKYKEVLRNPNFLNMKALELPTLLETADILNNGKVSMVKNTKQEQMSLEQLTQPNMVNPYTLGNRGEMSAYFRDKNGNVVADNTASISTISEGRTNLANILDYSTNEKAMASILTALKNEASSTFKNNGFHEDLSSKKSVKSNIDDFLSANMEIQSMIKKDASPSEIQKQMALMNTNLEKSVLSTEQKDVLSSGVDMFRMSKEILHNQQENSMRIY